MWNYAFSVPEHKQLQVKVRPCGAIGRYLFDQLVEVNRTLAPNPLWPHGELWGLGDEGCVCALMEELEREDGYRMIEAPHINDDMSYSPCPGNRPIRVYHRMDVRLCLEDLFAKLRINFGDPAK